MSPAAALSPLQWQQGACSVMTAAFWTFAAGAPMSCVLLACTGCSRVQEGGRAAACLPTKREAVVKRRLCLAMCWIMLFFAAFLAHFLTRSASLRGTAQFPAASTT
jgi:hypothetical protein